MDPEATLNRLDEALNDGDHEAIQEFSGYLIDWLEHNGFSPPDLGGWRANLTINEWLDYLHGVRRAALSH